MNANLIIQERQSNSDLAHVIKPLASYICAADRPRDVLKAALTALFDEVHATNNAALVHFSLRVDSLGLAS